MNSDQTWLATVEAAVLHALAANTRRAPRDIDPNAPLATLPGINSIHLLRAVADVEEACRLTIPDDLLFEASTPRELATLVAQLPGGQQ